MFFKRDNGREIEIEITWGPREPDVGIMSEYIDDYSLPPSEPLLSPKEEQRLFKTPYPNKDCED